MMPSLQPARQDAAAVPGEIDEIARTGENRFGSSGDLRADLGQRRLARPPLDQLDVKRLLEVADLHRQRRLGHRAGVRRAAEMAVLGQGCRGIAAGGM